VVCLLILNVTDESGPILPYLRINQSILSSTTGEKRTMTSSKWSLMFLIAILPMIPIARTSMATCTKADWRNGLGRPEHSAIYQGAINNRPIRMMLHLDPKSGSIAGVYGYGDQPGTLLLTGTLRPDGSGADLDERDTSGKVTGHFALEFIQQVPGYNPEMLKKYPLTCEAPVGIWRPASTGNTLKVKLGRDGESIPGNEGEEAADEAAAFKLRNAILQKNRKLFAALLNYPFFVVSYPENFKKFATPDDVIKHYDEVMTIPLEEVRDSVPHVLGAHSGTAYYLRDSVYLSNGKVKMICDGRCPVSAQYDLNLQ